MKRRRTEQQVLLDQFADMPTDQQEGVLKMLTEIHRQARRQEKRKTVGQTASNDSTEERETN